MLQKKKKLKKQKTINNKIRRQSDAMCTALHVILQLTLDTFHSFSCAGAIFAPLS